VGKKRRIKKKTQHIHGDANSKVRVALKILEHWPLTMIISQTRDSTYQNIFFSLMLKA
jgi:hypothetical protein